MIEKVKLKDFQAHKESEFTFTNGVNVITGVSGCLSGDTLISGYFDGSKNRKPIRLKRIYEYQQGLLNVSFRKASNTFYVKNCKEGTLDRTISEAVAVYSGKKQCFMLRPDSGKYIEATDEHKFYTDNGWVELSNLKVGDYIYQSVQKQPSSIKRKNTYTHEYYVKYHPTARTRTIYDNNIKKYYKYHRLFDHRIIYEAHLNNVTLEQYLYILNNDEEKASKVKTVPLNMEIHHKDGNHHNNDISNLVLLTTEEHAKLHQQETHRLKPGGELQKTQVISITKTKVIDTYDLCCVNNHNYIANGLLVHNSGKSSVIRALNYVFTNKKPNGVEYKRRPDAKGFEIDVTVDGHTIKRIKSTKINEYQIDGESYKDIGTSVPDKLYNVTNIRPIKVGADEFNVQLAKQFDPHFLMFLPDSSKVKFLNRLSGAHILDIALKETNRDLLSLEKDKLANENELTVVQSTINNLIDVISPIKDIVRDARVKYEQMCESKERLDKLKQAKEHLDSWNKQKLEFDSINYIISKVNIEGFEKAVVRLNDLKKLYSSFTDTYTQAVNVADAINKIDTLDVSMLEKSKTRLDKLHELLYNYQNVKLEMDSLCNQMEDLDGKINAQIIKVKTFLESTPVCPTCNATITKAKINKIIKELEQ